MAKLNVQPGQVWRVVQLAFSSAEEPGVFLMLEEKKRPHGQQWYWLALNLETGNAQAVKPWIVADSFKWERVT